MKCLMSFFEDTIYLHLNKIFLRKNEFKKEKPRKYEKKEEEAIVADAVSVFYNKWILKLDAKYDE